MINKIGPSIVPWGTPEITGEQSEQLPFSTTRCLLFVQKFLIHSNREPSILCSCSFSDKHSCGTLSKALQRSKKMISVFDHYYRPCPKLLNRERISGVFTLPLT